MPADLAEVMEKNPVLFTTATNDGAFWPAPYTAYHEYGCYNKTLALVSENAKPHSFVEFSKEACAEDNDRKPFPDGGHNCPMKKLDGGRPENPWVLHHIKLYTHMNGSQDSKCWNLIYGNDTNSLRNSKDVEISTIRVPAQKEEVKLDFIQ